MSPHHPLQVLVFLPAPQRTLATQFCRCSWHPSCWWCPEPPPHLGWYLWRKKDQRQSYYNSFQSTYARLNANINSLVEMWPSWLWSKSLKAALYFSTSSGLSDNLGLSSPFVKVLPPRMFAVLPRRLAIPPPGAGPAAVQNKNVEHVIVILAHLSSYHYWQKIITSVIIDLLSDKWFWKK